MASFLRDSTFIDRVRFFGADPEMLGAFAYTGIVITVTISNDLIPELTKLGFAPEWVKTNIVPHTRSVKIVRIHVGNEVISTANKVLISSLVPAMQALHAALADQALDREIKISTPHSLGILANSSLPSTGKQESSEMVQSSFLFNT